MFNRYPFTHGEITTKNKQLIYEDKQFPTPSIYQSV